MSESEKIIETNLVSKGDKARAIAKMGQEMLKIGFTHSRQIQQNMN